MLVPGLCFPNEFTNQAVFVLLTSWPTYVGIPSWVWRTPPWPGGWGVVSYGLGPVGIVK